MNHEIEVILQTLVIAVALGIFAQLLAHRWKLPAILPLLIFGIVAGPAMLGLFDPAGLGVHHLEMLIHLGVAIILFEGGLSLDLGQLRSVSGSVRNLLSIGTAITAVGAAWLAHELLGISWSTAALFGAIVTVTGPTVIVPLLRHLIAPRKVRTILVSEGLMIDPIGAVLAYLVLQWIVRQNLGIRELATDLLVLAFAGSLLGFAAGSIVVALLRNRHTAAELRSLTVLALLMGSYALAEMTSPQSGILASVVMGLTVSAAKVPDLSPIKVFKGQLTVLIISILFILLSAQLDLDAMMDLGVPGLLVVAGLILLVRPLAVFLSVPPRELPFKERLLLGLTAPRGIVAAAVASLSAIQLRDVGMTSEAAVLEGLVYLTIIITCTWATISSPLLPRLFGFVDDPSRRRVVMIGVHALSKALAQLLRGEGFTVVMIDGSRAKLDPMAELGMRTVLGDARDTTTFEDAGVERDTHVLALTANDELNILIAGLVREEFGVEHPVIAVQAPHEELGQRHGAWIDIVSGDRLPLKRWTRVLTEGQAELETITVPEEADRLAALRSLLRSHVQDYPVICGWKGDKPIFRHDVERIEDYDRLTVLLPTDPQARERLRTALSGPESAAEPLAEPAVIEPTQPSAHHGMPTPGEA